MSVLDAITLLLALVFTIAFLGKGDAVRKVAADDRSYYRVRTAGDTPPVTMYVAHVLAEGVLVLLYLVSIWASYAALH